MNTPTKRNIVTGILLLVAIILLGLTLEQYVSRSGHTMSAKFSLEAADENLSPFSAFERGSVVEVVSAEDDIFENRVVGWRQVLQVELRASKKVVSVDYSTQPGVPTPKFNKGDKVVLGSIPAPVYDADTAEQKDAEPLYVIVDRYRLPAILWIVAGFVLLIIVIALARGAASLLGLVFSLVVLLFGIVPNILAGHNPLLVTLIGSLCIVTVSTFLAHGFRRLSVIALVSILCALSLGLLLAFILLPALQLFGTGNSSALLLQAGLQGSLNLSGILLAGIIIGTLGVLDDVIITQVSSVEELSLADGRLSRSELYKKAMAIGRQHIAAVINTLVLAYAGVALPLILLMFVASSQPWWVVLNSEPIAEEIIRTIIGTASLILAVPIATLLAVRFYAGPKKSGANL